MAPKGRRRRLSVKQKALVEFLLDNPNATLADAGRAAGFEGKHPEQAAHGALKSVSVQETMAAMMEADPLLNNTALLEKLKEGLSAKKKTYSSHEGIITDSREDDDFGTRKEYLKLGLQVKGALINKQEISGGKEPVKLVDLSDVDPEALLKALKELE